jgi:uncharacterized membrane protein YhaH (DUF805 family)
VTTQLNCTFVTSWQTHCKALIYDFVLFYGQGIYPKFTGRFRHFHKEIDMLQIFFGIYLVLGLLATLLLWMALIAAKTHDTEYNSQHHYQMGLAVANLKNARSRRK